MAASSTKSRKFQPGGHAQLGLSKRSHGHRTAGSSDPEGSIISSSVVSHGTGQAAHREVRLENTYKTEPDIKFMPQKAQNMMKDVMKVFLQDKTYEAETCASIARALSSLVTQRAKELGFPRYKFVCCVTMGEKKNQDVQAASRCLWNNDTDTFATATYCNGDLFVTATLYGVYLE